MLMVRRRSIRDTVSVEVVSKLSVDLFLGRLQSVSLPKTNLSRRSTTLQARIRAATALAFARRVHIVVSFLLLAQIQFAPPH